MQLTTRLLVVGCVASTLAAPAPGPLLHDAVAIDMVKRDAPVVSTSDPTSDTPLLSVETILSTHTLSNQPSSRITVMVPTTVPTTIYVSATSAPQTTESIVAFPPFVPTMIATTLSTAFKSTESEEVEVATVKVSSPAQPNPPETTAAAVIANPSPSKSTVIVKPTVTVSNTKGGGKAPTVTLGGGGSPSGPGVPPTTTLNKVDPTFFPDGRPFKRDPKLNYCHVHHHPVYDTYRISGQLWGGKNVTQVKFYNAVSGCGQVSRRKWADPESEFCPFLSVFLETMYSSRTAT